MPFKKLLLADENFSKGVNLELQELGHDLITLRDLGLADTGFPDVQVLEKANELNRCVLTFNRSDFIKLHKEGKKHAGIVVCTFNSNSKELAGKIHEEISEIENLSGQLIRIYRN
jgi:predicted nuclease of predicted toxin-antitoxin system